jgi:glycosyltransferase involved in cell wall biosynthesis
VEDLVQKISYAIQNRQQFESIGESARQTAEQRADWKKNFGKLLEVYNKLSR